MYTLCTQCKTAFRIEPEDLAMAAGEVRCGRCGSTFNALLNLSNDPPTVADESPGDTDTTIENPENEPLPAAEERADPPRDAEIVEAAGDADAADEPDDERPEHDEAESDDDPHDEDREDNDAESDDDPQAEDNDADDEPDDERPEDDEAESDDDPQDKDLMDDDAESDDEPEDEDSEADDEPDDERPEDDDAETDHEPEDEDPRDDDAETDHEPEDEESDADDDAESDAAPEDEDSDADDDAETDHEPKDENPEDDDAETDHEPEDEDEDSDADDAETDDEPEDEDEDSDADDDADDAETDDNPDKAQDESANDNTTEQADVAVSGDGRDRAAEVQSNDAFDEHDAKDLSAYLTPPRSKAKLAALSLASLALATLLLAQLVHHFRADLATHPVFGGPVATLYDSLGIRLIPNWDVSSYDVEGTADIVEFSSLDANGQQFDGLRVSAIIVNNATGARPAPVVKLLLQNRWGETVAARDFLPADYVAPDSGRAFTLSPGEKLRIELQLVDPGEEVVGFDIDLCLHGATGLLNCANGKTN